MHVIILQNYLYYYTEKNVIKKHIVSAQVFVHSAQSLLTPLWKKD